MFKTVLLALWGILTTVQQSCASSCLQCYDGNKCKQCAVGYKKFGHYQCIKCLNVGCNDCQSDFFKCDSCTEGYHKIDSLCYPCSVQNCKICDQNLHQCEQCDDGYGLVNKTCQKCLFRIGQCLKCNIDLYKCPPCPQKSGQIYLAYNSVYCERCYDSQCLHCPDSYQICKECNVGYGLRHYFLCQPCNISRCRKCSWFQQHNHFHCDQCNAGYVVLGNDVCWPCVQNCKQCAQIYFQCMIQSISLK